jgi:branched-chain amino acid transport system ATP-binding protein
MLAIARALMLNPDLILVDEPTEGLAPIIVKEVAKVLEELSGEKITILLVEQNAKLALNLSSRCYVLSDGHLFYEGVCNVVKKDPDLMKRCFGVF